MKAVEWSEDALDDMAKLDRIVAGRMKKGIERFAATGAGNVLRLQGVDPPEYRLRIGDWRIRFAQDEEFVTVLRVKNRREAYR